MYIRVAIQGDGVRSSLGRGHLELNLVPIGGFGSFLGQDGVADFYIRGIGGQFGRRVERHVVNARGIGHRRLQVGERQVGQISQQERSHHGLVLEALIFEVGRRGPLEAVHAEGAHGVRLHLAGIAGAVGEVAAPARGQHVVGREVACGVGSGFYRRAHTVEDGVQFYAGAFIGCASAGQCQLSAQFHRFAGVVAVSGCRYAEIIEGGDVDCTDGDGVVEVEQFALLATIVDGSSQLVDTGYGRGFQGYAEDFRRAFFDGHLCAVGGHHVAVGHDLDKGAFGQGGSTDVCQFEVERQVAAGNHFVGRKVGFRQCSVGQGAVADEQPARAEAVALAAGQYADGAVALFGFIGGYDEAGRDALLSGGNCDGGRHCHALGVRFELHGECCLRSGISAHGEHYALLVSLQDGAGRGFERKHRSVVVRNRDGDVHEALSVAHCVAATVGYVDGSLEEDGAVAVHLVVVHDAEGEVGCCRAGGQGDGAGRVVQVAVFAVVGQSYGDFIACHAAAGQGGVHGRRTCALAHRGWCDIQADGGHVVVVQDKQRLGFVVALGGGCNLNVQIVCRRIVIEDGNLHYLFRYAVRNYHRSRQAEASGLFDVEVDHEVAFIGPVGVNCQADRFAFVVVRFVRRDVPAGFVVFFEQYAVLDGVVAVVLERVDVQKDDAVHVDFLVVHGLHVEVGFVGASGKGKFTVVGDSQSVCASFAVLGRDAEGLCLADVARSAYFAGVVAAAVFRDGTCVGRHIQIFLDVEVIVFSGGCIVVFIYGYFAAVGGRVERHDGSQVTVHAGKFAQRDDGAALHAALCFQRAFKCRLSYEDAVAVLVFEPVFLGPAGPRSQFALVFHLELDVQVVAGLS